MSAFNETAAPNDRGVCFMVAESRHQPPTYFVIRVNLNDPDNRPGLFQATVASKSFASIEEADAEARRLYRHSLT